jgi:non-canonical purine NTP pyrophosphatase (RdgB/HAM1 family)
MYFVTGSKQKFQEARHIMPCLVQLDIDLLEIQEIDAHKIIAAKLYEARTHHDGALVVEDTSLHFVCLNGLPGPLIKWFMKSIGTDGLYEIVQKYNNDRAYVRTTIGCMMHDGKMQFCESELWGRIVSPRGNNGFGWDAIFMPDKCDKTLAEMDVKEKNEISARGTVFEELKKYV